MRGTRFEISTRAKDDSLQGIAGDPYGSPYYFGIPVPLGPTPDPTRRYLLQLARRQFNAHEKGRLVGIGQYVQIGASYSVSPDAAVYPLNLDVTSPYWHFTDGNISWHLMRFTAQTFREKKAIGIQPGDSEAYQYSEGTPSLLAQEFVADAGGYVPPNGGRPYGSPLVGDLGTFNDLRFPWRQLESGNSIDFEIEGPCDIVLFASVQQTDPDTRATLILPGGYDLNSLPTEDRFVLANPNAVYTRIAGRLLFENPNMTGDPAQMKEAPLPPGITP